MAFAGLHQLVRPLLNRAQGLRRPSVTLCWRRSASTKPGPDPFFVALRVPRACDGEARKAPLLVVVDDAHWLDRHDRGRAGSRGPSAGFGASGAADRGSRRVRDRARRVRPAGATHRGDGRAVLECLLDSHAAGLGPELRGRVLAAAAGNPLALIELAAAVGSGSHVAFGVPERLPMTARLEHAMVERFCDLPAATRTVLLVASADTPASWRY